ncbi:DUF3102 domain-containing protein [Glaesserella parasuis]|uniref:DUF3102 domain-containing protein n=1 Tax=Glaesserella parasuis TaxID=738 RepID=UPI002717E30E|nr:DUF3102 domain-containing protein [Glaesserella parasuis]MDE4014080.1 DUF3102 domain-containing protein [Glaesserella parasuis]MDO9778897.1 DUF3102 domain-containing protein [Glaesserella parasuis]MDO9958741.1 DUF3102 domain-containing protein [Glaesserella parasuis]MDP0052128.1 DUF3102 domain-containing protein [Glaesserella parasuis]
MTETTEKSTSLSNETYLRHSMAIMDKWGNGEVFDKKIIVDRGKHCQRSMVESMLEFGRVLIILKEHLAHGEFVETLQNELDVTPRAAQKFMQATLKFCGEGLQDTTPKLVQLGKSKLLELVTQDDDDLKELAEGGTVAGLKLDEIDRMTRDELRKALRKAREDKDAMAKVLVNKDEKINRLDVDLAKKQKLIETQTPEQRGGVLREETAGISYKAEAILRGQVFQAFESLQAHQAETGIDHRQFMSGVLAEYQLILSELKEHFNLDDEPTGDALPEWARAPIDEPEELDDRMKAILDAEILG